MTGTKSLELIRRGVRLRLLPERALYRPAQGDLVVSDLHLGKEAVFQRRGIPVPEGSSRETLDQLAALADDLRPKRIILLGDLFHDPAALSEDLLGLFEEWHFHVHRSDIFWVRGNHDPRHIPTALADKLEWMEAFIEPPFLLTHEPVDSPNGLYNLHGHIHPVMVLKGPGRQKLRAPCFRFGDQDACLPAFGAFTGGAEITPAEGEDIIITGPGAVMRVPR